MRNFVRLVELVRSQGIVGTHNGISFQTFKPHPHFWDEVEKCQPIVFQRKNAGPAELPDDPGDDYAPKMGSIQLDDFDAPFKIFSVEMIEGPISSPREDDEFRVFIWCIMCVEIAPKEFVFQALCQSEKQDGSGRDWFVFASNAEGPIVKELLKRLHSEAVGIENVRQRLEIGTGQEKRVIRVRKIVHVRPRSEAKRLQEEPKTARQIDWSHRWTVRGHWVTFWKDEEKTIVDFSRLGKDRDGNYCVSGYTWRDDHVKGPESAPLIVKTRLVTQGDGTK